MNKTHQIHPWAAMDHWRDYDHMLVEHGKGIYLWDSAGKRFLDGHLLKFFISLALIP